jgi:hypothetical protein
MFFVLTGREYWGGQLLLKQNLGASLQYEIDRGRGIMGFGIMG